MKCPRCGDNKILRVTAYYPEDYTEIPNEPEEAYQCTKCEYSNTSIVAFEDKDKPREGECPDCKFFMVLGLTGYLNVCQGFEPWSCQRTQNENKCHFNPRDTNESVRS